MLVERISSNRGRCRCGTALPAGGPCLGLIQLPPALVELLAGYPFCSVVCVRAWLLEAIELFEARSASIVVQDAPAVLAALRAVYDRLPRAS